MQKELSSELLSQCSPLESAPLWSATDAVMTVHGLKGTLQYIYKLVRERQREK